MLTGYHLRFLKIDEAARSIDGADIVRVLQVETGAYSFGVQLHAHAMPPPQDDETVLRLTRRTDESEGEFVKRAFCEAAARQRQQTDNSIQTTDYGLQTAFLSVV